MGNIDSLRDWGHAKDYCYGMWLMLQQDKPDDYVLSSNEYHSVKEFIEKSFLLKGFNIKWKGCGINEIGYDEKEYEIEDQALNPESNADGSLKNEKIQDAIQQLSPRFRQVIILREIEELSYEEISKIINAPLGTVKSRVNRARNALQEYLKDILEF